MPLQWNFQNKNCQPKRARAGEKEVGEADADYGVNMRVLIFEWSKSNPIISA